jgi:hypothetical protein
MADQQWSPNPPPAPQPQGSEPPPPPPKPSLWQRIARHKLLTAAVVAVVLAGSGAVAYSALREDSGVAACKAMAARTNSTTTNTEFTAKDYQRTRKLFADSDDAAIRTNGTKLIDAAWQASKTTDNNAFSVLALVGSMTDAYTGLTGACASHGVTLPPLSSLSGASPPASAPSASAPPASDSSGFPDEGVTQPTTPKFTTAKLRVGQTANLALVDEPVGSVGAVAPTLAVDPSKPTAARLQVARVKTTRGSEFDTPERGYYLGVYVKAQNLHVPPNQVSWEMYVVVNGHHYDSAFAAEGFSPEFGNASLAQGETDEGWMVFDVPASHGTVVTVDPASMDSRKIATWTF